MKLKGIIAAGAVLGGLLAIGAGLALFKWSQIHRAMSMPPPPEFPEAVVVAPVERLTWGPTARLSGTVVAKQSVMLSNEVAGRVSDVRFESGAAVDAGQVLFVLDSSTQQADLDAARASHRVAQANVRVAESNQRLHQANHGRIVRASEENATTPFELDQSQANLDQAEALLAQAQAEEEQAAARIRQLETTIAKMSLIAPFRARAGLRNVHPGQYLPEDRGVVALQSIDDTIYLDFAVPQDQASRVKKGDVVMASVPAISPDPQPITVVAIDAIADRGTRNVRIRGEIANPDERLRPGMWIDVEVPVETPREHLIIPATAVRRAPYGEHVFVVAPDPAKPENLRAQQRFVKLGAGIGDSVIVVDGLRDGEVVATEGSFKLRNGALVRPGDPSGSGDRTAGAVRDGSGS